MLRGAPVFAGVGSLGRPRYVAVADVHGGLVAREAKAFVVSAATWAKATPAAIPPARLLQRAVRCADPFYAVTQGWIVRRLAPDCSRIELDELPDWRDEARLLRAMGFETANIHLGSLDRRVIRDLDARPRRWLEKAAEKMADVVREDWRSWVKK
jgi:hypothetical protein